MGRNNKKYHKDLKEQIYILLTKMLHAGEGTSKKKAIADGSVREKIFSYNTYKSYWRHCKIFANFVKERHPDCTTIRSAKKYVNEWLQSRVDNGGINGKPLSAWTIVLERQALGKLYGIRPDDPDYFQAPKRQRVDIKRSRGEVKSDKNFSELNNEEFVSFARSTGCRRNVMKKLEGRDFFPRYRILEEIKSLKSKEMLTETESKYLEMLKEGLATFPDQAYFLLHRSDKGGKSRIAPIIGTSTDKIIARMMATAPYEKVWKCVPSHADIHNYRSIYATAIYRMYARPIEKIPYDKIHKGLKTKYQSEVYVYRKDELGKRLDKVAMLKVSKALGHNRLDVVAIHYLRGL